MSRTLWHLGNTTVRSPFRLREGLIALKNSSLEGNLHGENQEVAFRLLLGKAGVVELGEDSTYSVGRKWRSALNKLGFLVPELPKSGLVLQSEIGVIDRISENGLRLIKSDTVPAMQECFLRALAAYQIPNSLEKGYEFNVFSPLKFVLQVLIALEQKSGSSVISLFEIGIFVLCNTPDTDLDSLIKEILDFRKNRKESENKKAFDNSILRGKAKELGRAETTFADYADTTIRYLKATGLVVASGRGIMIYEEKRALILELIAQEKVILEPTSYYTNLLRGAKLPTDEIMGAKHVLKTTQIRAKSFGLDFLPVDLSNIADINSERHRLEQRLFEIAEEEFAKNQANQIDNIIGYLNLLISNSRSLSQEESAIYIPSSERPAYLEWVIWRAFLAINSLDSKPYEARRFKIDQSFLPISPAAGNGPDLIFEYSKFVLVVEATLTENSRQEAVEGESVRRHVTDISEQYRNKPTYGLFIARNVNTNTAHTFKLGIWYARDDKQVEFAIVPITLLQFKEFFISLVNSSESRPERIKAFLENCLKYREQYQAPEWKVEIQNIIKAF